MSLILNLEKLQDITVAKTIEILFCFQMIVRLQQLI